MKQNQICYWNVCENSLRESMAAVPFWDATAYCDDNFQLNKR